MPEQYDLDTVRAQIRELVDREGADTIGDSVYVHFDGNGDPAKPGCIVGWWAHDYAPDLYEMMEAEDVIGSLMSERRRFAPFVNDDARRYLGYLQLEQDMGAPWGKARDFAERAYKTGIL